MFNEELKGRFVTENYDKESTRNTILVALNKSEKFEQKLNKDLSEFSEEEINAFLKSKDSGSFPTLQTAVAYYRQYAQFVAQETGIKNDYLMNINLDILKRVVPDKIKEENSRFISRKNLLKFCSALKNPRDKAILLGIYEGISVTNPNEFLDIRPEDIHQNYIYIPSRDFKLRASKELIQFFQEAMKSDRYEYMGLLRAPKKIALVDGDRIAIKVPEDLDPEMSVRSVLKRVSNLTDEVGDLTIPNLRKSGMVDKIIKEMDEHHTNLKTAYKICRPVLCQEYNVDEVKRSTLFRVAEFLIEERERERKNG